MFETFTFNLAGGVREETLNGRQYLVAKCVMGVEGVLHGSNGPGFYPAEEWRKGVPAWNMKPITLDHPYDANGQPKSAADPVVIQNKQLGFLLNTEYRDKMRTECWFDAEHTRQRSPEVYNALKTRKMVEVSTGVIVDQDKTAGDHKGRKFDWIARHHRPDHLAVLPGKVGACSIADGAGLLANEACTLENLLVANEEFGRLSDNPPTKETDVEKKTLVDQIIANGKANGTWTEAERDFLMGKDEAWLKKHATTATPPAPPATPPVTLPVAAPVANATPPAAPQSLDQYIANAPPELQGILRQSVAVAAQQKEGLIANILGAPTNKFSKEWLATQPLDVLSGIAAMAVPTVTAPPAVLQPNFGGQAIFPINNAAATGTPAAPPALVVPTMSFPARTK